MHYEPYRVVDIGAADFVPNSEAACTCPHSAILSHWADPDRVVLVGASEGSVAVARYIGHEFAGRIIYSLSCEPNYFVTNPMDSFENDKPVLNVISFVDPYFSRTNLWLGNPTASGNCAEALKDDKKAVIVLIPGAPHTLINLPAARDAAVAFFLHLDKPSNSKVPRYASAHRLGVPCPIFTGADHQHLK
jgi:hypothetical protein